MTKLLSLFSLALFLSYPLSAQVVFTDSFSSGTAADADYYRFGTTDTSLSVGSGTLNFTYEAGAANRSGVIKQFSNTTLALGETLTFSFTINSRNLRNDENNSFRFSIGNIGTAVTGDLSSAEPFSSGTRRNYVFAAATGTASTAFNQHSAGFASPVNGGTVTAISGLAASNFAHSSSDPFAVSVSFTRTATGLDIAKNFGGNLSSGSFTTSTAADFDFNTIAFSLNNAGDYSVSLDNISVSVIPEPATAGLFLGGIGLIVLWRRFRTR
jgi:hypothetical protein